MAHRFRTTKFHQEGNDAATIIHGRVLNVNMVNWTVDVISQFDRHYYFDVQVGSAYLHYNNGEGIYCMPEVGAVVMLCVPSDSSPPYVCAFVAPMEVANGDGKFNNPDNSVVTTQQGTQEANTSDVADDDAPAGTRSRGGAVSNPKADASFAAGRPTANPGDIIMRTRDGNFIALRRGGVIEIGATELAQRLFIPIGNKIIDVSEEYEHDNVGGTEWWGLQEGPSITNEAAQKMETYRLLANDQYADLRIAKSNVFNPIPEPAGSGGADAVAGFNETNNALSNKVTNPVVYEVVLARQGFRTRTGEIVDKSTISSVKLKFFFDLNGNIFLRAEGSAYFAFAGKVTVAITGPLELTAETISMKAKNGATLDGGPSTEIKGDVVRLQEGTTPVARLGDSVQGGVGVTTPVPMLGTITLAGSPPYSAATFSGFISIPSGVVGSIISGNPNLLG